MHRLTPALEVVDLRIIHQIEGGPTWTLTGVSFRIYPHEVVALIGPPSPALSVLLSCLAGDIEPNDGIVRIDGESRSGRSMVERSMICATTVGTLGRVDDLVDD